MPSRIKKVSHPIQLKTKDNFFVLNRTFLILSTKINLVEGETKISPLNLIFQLLFLINVLVSH